MNREEAIEILTEIQTKHKKYIGQTECNNALNMAIEALSDDWIPVSEKLPESNGDYLVTYEESYAKSLLFSIGEELKIIDIVPFDADCGGFRCDPITLGYVVAWQPLPKPYKEQKDD